MIDNFSLALSHGLMMLAAWRLLQRPDLDEDGAPRERPRLSWAKRRSTGGDAPGA